MEGRHRCSIRLKDYDYSQEGGTTSSRILRSSLLIVVMKSHARFEAERRGIPEESIKDAVKNPQQKLPSKKGRVIVQNRYYDKV